VIGDGVTVLEAVRATYASPTYFDPVKIGHREFVDGALGANNPVQHAYFAAKSSWPDRPVECLLSLGSGSEPSAMKNPSLGRVEITRRLVAIVTENERTAHEFERRNEHDLRGGKYLRFGPITARQDLRLDDLAFSQSTVANAVDEYLSTARNSEMIADFARLLSQPKSTGGHNATKVLSSTTDTARRLKLPTKRNNHQETEDDAPGNVESSSSDTTNAHAGLPTAIATGEKNLSIEHPVTDKVAVSQPDLFSKMLRILNLWLWQRGRVSRASKVARKIIIANAIAQTMLQDSRLRPLLETAATGVGKVRMERNLSILLSHLGQELSALDSQGTCKLLGTVVIRPSMSIGQSFVTDSLVQIGQIPYAIAELVLIDLPDRPDMDYQQPPSYEDVIYAGREIGDLSPTFPATLHYEDVTSTMLATLLEVDRQRLTMCLTTSEAYHQFQEDLWKFTYPSMGTYIRSVLAPRLPDLISHGLEPICSVIVNVEWQVAEFILDQCESFDNLNNILTLTGSSNRCQALSCQDYMAQAWPNTGRDILDLIQLALKHGNSCKFPIHEPE
jgi:hypothetical protein